MSRNAKGYYPLPQLGPSIEYPSVTTIQSILRKQWLEKWYVDTGVDYLYENGCKALLDGAITIEQFREIDWPKLVSDSKLAHLDISGEAKDFGSRLHAALDEYHKGAGGCPTDLADAMAKIIEWEELVKLKTIESETTVYSTLYQFAGTADHLAEITLNETPLRGILDYKCRNGKNGQRIPVYQTDRQQIGAYAFAYEEMTKKHLDYGGIIVYNRELNRVEPHIYQRAMLEQPLMEFLLLCQYFNLCKRRVK